MLQTRIDWSHVISILYKDLGGEKGVRVGGGVGIVEVLLAPTAIVTCAGLCTVSYL